MNLKWAHHDSIGYVFPTVTSVDVKNETQSGSWFEINSSESEDIVDMDVFSLWIDHGTRPSGKSYEYILVPGIDKNETQIYSSNVPVRTIANTANIQAVRQDRIQVTGVVFYTAGQVLVRSGLTLVVNQPCIALLQEEGNEVHVSISNPKGEQLSVNTTLNWANANNETKTFNLPGGGDGGKSVTQEFANANPVSVSKKALIANQDVSVFYKDRRILVNFALKNSSAVKVSLFSLDGKLEMEVVGKRLVAGKQNIPIDTQGLGQGVYVVRIETGYRQVFSKVFVKGSL